MMKTPSMTLNPGLVTDCHLWDQLRHGDQEAFGTLYGKYVNVLFNYGRNLTNDVELIRDCIHSVFLNLWLQHERLREVKRVKYYLFKVIKRKIGKERQVARKRCHWEPCTTVLSYEERLITDIAQQERIAVLQRKMNHLTKRQRQIISLRYYENLSNEEIAEVMNISINTVYNTVSLAIQTLKKEMGA